MHMHMCSIALYQRSFLTDYLEFPVEEIDPPTKDFSITRAGIHEWRIYNCDRVDVKSIPSTRIFMTCFDAFPGSR